MKRLVRRSTKYIINGREYGSLEEMPEVDRQFFEDANGDGIPDGMQAATAAAEEEAPPLPGEVRREDVASVVTTEEVVMEAETDRQVRPDLASWSDEEIARRLLRGRGVGPEEEPWMRLGSWSGRLLVALVVLAFALGALIVVSQLLRE